MGTGIILGNTPTKIGWQGQPAVTVPKGGLQLVPGAGVIGRTDTAQGLLYVDLSTTQAAETVQFFIPGTVAAKTVGVWRNRRASGRGTVSIIEVNALTAPTVSGDASNFWRLTLTDSLANVVQLPISVAGQKFYDLNTLANNAVIAAGAYAGAGNDSTSSGGNLGIAHKIVPTQNLVVGGATVHARFYDNNANTPLGGKRCRFTLMDAQFNVLATAIAYTTGTLDNTVANGGTEQIVHTLGETVTLLSGGTYYMSWDFLLDWGLSNNWVTANQYAAGWGRTGVNNLPSSSANVDGIGVAGFGINANANRDINVDTGTNTFWNNANGQRAANIAAVNNLTYDQILSGTAPAGVLAPAGGSPLGFLTNLASAASVQSGAWSVNGAPSGVAPEFGDLTFALSANGAPAAGTAPADINVRALILQ